MLQILKASKSNPFSPLPSEIKEYTGQVKVVSFENKGRGLLAQQAFSPGDLIISQRAVAIVFPESDKNPSTSSLLNKVKRFRLLKETVAKLVSSDEELALKVCSLHAGPKLGYLDQLSNNKEGKPKVSLSRIEGVLIVNGFEGQRRGASLEGPFGLWYLPSFLNHDCSKTNANWEIFNDFIFIRATKFIENNEEILIREVSTFFSCDHEQQIFLFIFSKTCKIFLI